MKLLALLRDSLRLMVGVPSYQAYVDHMRRKHPDRAAMSYPEFVKDRQLARFGGKGPPRCC
jgi:uncharacterized short protein YbdD (DUF466 family)